MLPPVTIPTPVTGTPGSHVADTSSPQAGTFTLALNMSAATGQVFGLIIVALALTLAATKLVADYFTPHKRTEASRRGSRRTVRAGHGSGTGPGTCFSGAPVRRRARPDSRMCRRNRSPKNYLRTPPDVWRASAIAYRRRVIGCYRSPLTPTAVLILNNPGSRHYIGK